MTHKPYPKYKDSGVEWIGEIPSDWEIIKLRYLTEINTGSADTQDKIDDGEYPFFVRSPIIEKIDYYTNDETAVLTAGDGVGVGKVFHYYEGKFTAHQRVYIFNEFKNIHPKYLYYYLQRNLAFEVLMGGAKSTVDSIRREMLTNFPITLPTLNYQNKIVLYLNASINKIESIIEQKKDLIALLEEKRQAVITEAVTKGLNPNVPMTDSGVEWIGEIPEHWEIGKLKRWLNVRNGREIGKEVEETSAVSYPVYGSGGIFKWTNDYLFEGESVLFGRKGTIGEPLYVQGRFWTVDTMYFTEYEKESLPKYFYYLLKCFPWSLIMTKTALPSIVGTEVENEFVAIPPLDEQNEIVNYLNGISDRTEKVILVIENQIEKLKAYRESLIYEAVTGKIDLR